MLLLLPPSEAKTAPLAGGPVNLGALSHPELAPDRQRVGDALIRVSGQRNALTLLGLGPSVAEELTRNRALWSAPSAPAATVYTGVLYEAAGMEAWDTTTLDRAAQRVRIISGLWGALSPADPIPAYRLPIVTRLGRLGGLAAFWRPRLAGPLDNIASGGLIVDCRSSSYMAAWHPTDAPWVSVRVMRELDGARTVVSHMAKHTRGVLAGHLLGLDSSPETLHDLADAASGIAGLDLRDLALTINRKGPDVLTLVISGKH